MRKERVFVPAILATIVLCVSGSTSFGDAIFENVQGSAEVLYPPNGAIFYVQNPGDYRSITATGESEISYTVTTDDAPLSVLHFYSITLNGREDGDAVFHFQPNTTTVHSFATGPLTLTQDCGVGRHWVGVHQQAVNGTTSEIIGSVSDGYAFDVKVIPATATGSLQPLGVLPGYPGTHAYNISADGSTVVGHCSISSYFQEIQAFRWKNGTMIGLGCLAGYPPDSMALGVSADGSVVVGVSGARLHGDYSELCRAFRWANGTMTELPSAAWAVAADVSADGSFIAGNTGGALREACRWGPGGTITLLGSPWPSPYNNYALGISADGSVVVGFGTGGGFRWEDGTITRLGSGCCCVSADGSVVVGWGSSGGACRWENGTMTSLGHLGQCAPHDVSADGSVVVGMYYRTWPDFDDPQAFIWDANHGLRNLHDVLVNDYLINPGGYQFLWEARGISDDGFTILCGSSIARLDMGMVTAVRGNVTLEAFKAKLFDRIRRLSAVETGGDGYVNIRHPSGSEINIGPNSKMQPDGSPAKTNLELFKGKIRARVWNHPGPFEMITPHTIGAVRGTELVVETTPNESLTIVLEGSADVSTPNGSQTILLGENQGVIATAAGLGAPFGVDPNQIDRWWEWEVEGDFYADFDLEYIYQAPPRATQFDASNQKVAPSWWLELDNAGELNDPDCQIDRLTFQAPYQLFNLDPEPDIVEGHNYVWTGITIAPGGEFEVDADQDTRSESAYFPYTITRDFNDNGITGQGDLTTTVTIVPEEGITGFDVEIFLYAAQSEQAWHKGNFFGTLNCVSYSMTGGSPVYFYHDDTPISQEYGWEFWDGYVPGEPLTFTVTIHVDLNDSIDWALIEPGVEVCGRMDADFGSENWVENTLQLPNEGGAITIDSSGQLSNSDSTIPWIGVYMPQYAASSKFDPAVDFSSDDIVTNEDLAMFGPAWKSTSGDANWNPAYDISDPSDGVINEVDLAVFAANWLACP